jgi:hypothetical protein
MKFAARTVLVTLILVTGAALVVLATGGSQPVEVRVPAHEPPTAEAPGAAKGRAVGMSGCLATACHGGPAQKVLAGNIDPTCWQSSGSAWVAADPHTAAYSLLTDAPLRPVAKTAKEIMARYAPGTNATEDARCLACHSNPTLVNEDHTDARVQALRSEGVSCESCHGNAGGWVREHTTWKGDRKDMYAATGMTPLYDVGERAVTCAGCHVGAPAEGGRAVRDMNHDMIAAGHPRLNFDFAEYLRRLPPHWQEKDRTAPDTPPRTLNAAKVWLVGRYAHAEAACELLADRAGRAKAADEHTPWPEFAEFNCAACHHNLRVSDTNEKYANWRQSKEYLGDRPPGSPPWQTVWPVGHAPGLASPERRKSALADVVVAMEVARPAKPEAAKGVAEGAAAKLRRHRLDLVSRPDAKVEGEARNLFPAGAPLVPEWDSAGQLFFGLAALERARGNPDAAVVESYRRGAAAFRARDWPGVEQTFAAIRSKK